VRRWLRSSARFGSEVVARLLGLRKNHEARNDALELLPNDTSTRAEAAFSAAQILRFRHWDTSRVETLATAFELPQYTPWQRKILQTAVNLIGYPYVWGGTSSSTQTLFGVTSRGGFDCSGYVWRVYKLQRYPGGEALARTIKGRTTAQMAGEVPESRRITFANLRAGTWSASPGPAGRSPRREFRSAAFPPNGGWHRPCQGPQSARLRRERTARCWSGRHEY
jgi:hypothetical protein